MTPQRIQRSRKAGSKLPPNTVCVTRGRGMKWGNPFRVGDCYPINTLSGCVGDLSIDTPEIAVEEFRKYITDPRTGLDVSELRGKNLACFCPLDQPCHADVLLELANR